MYHRYVDSNLLNERKRLHMARERYLLRFDPDHANIDRIRMNLHWVAAYLSHPVDDDSAHSFDIPWSDPSRALIWMGVDLTGHSFLFSVTGPLAGAANFTALFTAPAGTLEFASGALTGTTGPDGHLSVAIDTGGATPRFYIENRLGAARQITLATLGR